MLLSFLLEFSLFIYLITYMISFFVEKDTRFLFFFVLQVIIFLFFICCNTPFLSFNLFFLSVDYLNFFFKAVALVCFFIFVIFFYFWFDVNLKDNLFGLDKFQGIFEFLLLGLIVLLSGFLFISSNDFLFLYIFLEIQSICLYILAAFQYDTNRSTEASLKYFIFGALFSGLFLLGWSLIFASSGLSNFIDLLEWQGFLNEYLIYVYNNAFFEDYFFFSPPFFSAFNYFYIVQFRLIYLGLFFIILSIVAKLGLFPFHFWMVDVYDSVSAITLLFFSVFPKLFLIGFLIRLFIFFKFFLSFNYFLLTPLYLFSIGSILWGSFSNLSQWKVQRFLAFSSLVNLGYIMFFFVRGDMNFFAVIGVSLNLIIYFVLVFSFFSVFLFLRRHRINEKIMDLTEFFMIKNTSPLIGFSLFINMLSFAGVPPLLGFFGKFYLIGFLWYNQMWYSMFFILFVSLLSAFYYIRIARTFFNFNSVKVLFKDLNFGIFIINFIFILVQIFFIFILFFYFFIFIEYLSFLFV
jgi:NADH-quinone oxidoreductase subunit N